MSAVEILQPNGDGGDENLSLNSNPDSLEDIPASMIRSDELPKTKSEVFFERMSQSSGGKGSPAKKSSAIRRAASVTGASNEDFRQYAVAGHMSPTISSRRRCQTNDTSSLVLPNKRKSSKEKEKDTISLPCMMTRPTPRENRACRKRIELSHRNHLDFPHDHYQDHDHHHHHHHHHNHKGGECGGHSHGNNHGHTLNSHANNHANHSSSQGQSNNSSSMHGQAHATSSSHGQSHFNSHGHSSHSSNHSHNNNHSHNGSSSTSYGHHGSPSPVPKAGHGYASEVSADEYLTPLQRKDQVIRGLKEELKKTQKKLSDLNMDLISAKENAGVLEYAIAQKGRPEQL